MRRAPAASSPARPPLHPYPELPGPCGHGAWRRTPEGYSGSRTSSCRSSGLSRRSFEQPAGDVDFPIVLCPLLQVLGDLVYRFARDGEATVTFAGYDEVSLETRVQLREIRTIVGSAALAPFNGPEEASL